MSAIFSPGKLLLTSEYVVLDGALALAVPTKWGQDFTVQEINDGKSLVKWSASHQNKLWLEAIFNYKEQIILETNILSSAEFVLKVLSTARQFSEHQLQSDTSYVITTNLQFPPDYGLGSSSTLMNNVATWAKIDAFNLNSLCLGGSGYDIAVAQEKSALLFRNSKDGRQIEKIHFKPEFREELIFIHLNQKQNSREGINFYKSKPVNASLLDDFSILTNRIVNAKSLEEFSELMFLHEKKLSKHLQISPVKEKFFESCPTFVKSLGAWGGDFVMSAKFPSFEAYFQGKGFHTIFTWDDLIAS